MHSTRDFKGCSLPVSTPISLSIRAGCRIGQGPPHLYRESPNLYLKTVYEVITIVSCTYNSLEKCFMLEGVCVILTLEGRSVQTSQFWAAADRHHIQPQAAPSTVVEFVCDPH